MKKIAIVIMVFFGIQLFGQKTTYIPGDPHWIYDSIHSDEFNDNQINWNLWHYSWPPSAVSLSGSSCHPNDPYYLMESGNYVRFRGDKPINGSTLQCTDWQNNLYNLNFGTGTLVQKKTFKYGYVEARVHIPPAEKRHHGFSSSFWLWPWGGNTSLGWDPPSNPYSKDPLINPYSLEHSEIDIFEINSSINQYMPNVHLKYHHSKSKYTYNDTNNPVAHIINFSDDESKSDYWRTYSVDWYPNEVHFYVDGRHIGTAESALWNLDHLVPMNIVINIGVGDKTLDDPSTAKHLEGATQFGTYVDDVEVTEYPYEMLVDHIRRYYLRLDEENGCSNDFIVRGYNFFNYDYTVKRFIRIGNSIIPNNHIQYLRASDSFEFHSDFIVPLGSELHVIPTNCYVNQ